MKEKVELGEYLGYKHKVVFWIKPSFYNIICNDIYRFVNHDITWNITENIRHNIFHSLSNRDL